jgi:thioredoxin reductase (NADPH)
MEPALQQAAAHIAKPHDPPIEADAVIVGAGPVGLFQVFELGLLEIKAHVIDSLAYPGGQPVELYPDKPIYDIPAVPVCTGQELTDALLKQIEPFGATFHLGQEVTVVKKQADGRFFVATSKGHELSHQDDFHRSRRGGVPAAHAQGGRSGAVRGFAAVLPRQATRPTSPARTW